MRFSLTLILTSEESYLLEYKRKSFIYSEHQRKMLSKVYQRLQDFRKFAVKLVVGFYSVWRNLPLQVLVFYGEILKLGPFSLIKNEKPL